MGRVVRWLLLAVLGVLVVQAAVASLFMTADRSGSWLPGVAVLAVFAGLVLWLGRPWGRR